MIVYIFIQCPDSSPDAYPPSFALTLFLSSTSLVEQLVSVAPGRTCQRHRLMFPWSRSMLELHTIPYQALVRATAPPAICGHRLNGGVDRRPARGALDVFKLCSSDIFCDKTLLKARTSQSLCPYPQRTYFVIKQERSSSELYRSDCGDYPFSVSENPKQQTINII